LSNPTRGLVGAAELGLMKPSALEAVEGFLAGKPVRKLNELSRANR
jgi:hypothetical protein